jgi:DNA polymerase IV
VAQRDDPGLRGKPVLVGGSVERGVVAAASYEAREFGIHSAMPMAEALRRCPRAVVVGHDWPAIERASRDFFSILRDFSPLVEPLSVDEAFLDASGTERLFGGPEAIARAIKRRVRDEIDLCASVGVAPTKFVAKIASDIDKPDGLRVVAAAELIRFLHELPVARLWGVGRVTQARLEELGLATIGDVARYPRGLLERRLGRSLGAHLALLARGEDDRPVVPDHEPVSIGHEETFDRDLSARAELAPILTGQAERVAARLRRAGLRARIVVLKVKYGDFRLVTRRRSLSDPTSDGAVLSRAALELLEEVPIGARGRAERVRLCGVAASGLEPRDGPRQLTLDEAGRARGERLGDALDQIRDRFGEAAVARAPAVTRTPSATGRRPRGPTCPLTPPGRPRSS